MPIVATTGTVDRSEDDTAHNVFAQSNLFRAAAITIGNIFFGITQNGVIVFNGHGIPPRSQILTAELFLTATANQGDQFDTDIFAIGGDPQDIRGQVWSDDTFDAWRPSVWGRFRTIVRDSAAAVVFDSDPAVSPLGSWAINFEAEKKRSLGALFTVPSVTVLGAVEPMLSRINAPTGNLFVSIYAVAGGLPTGPALATSDAVPVTNVPLTAAARAFVNFPFSGADQITLQPGVEYVAAIDEPTYPITGVDFIQWHEQRAFFSVGISKHLGIGRQFDYQNFPLQGDIGTTSSFFRLGSAVNWNIPTFVVGFTLSTGLTNLAPVIQECVDEVNYISGRRIAIVLDGSGEASNRSFATFDHATLSPPRLEITYIPSTGGFVQQAKIVIAGATQAEIFDAVANSVVSVPGATQSRVYQPVKQRRIYSPGKRGKNK